MLTQGWGDFIRWLEGHQASAEVFVAIAALVVTAVLVGVTISYVRAARRQAGEAKGPHGTDSSSASGGLRMTGARGRAT